MTAPLARSRRYVAGGAVSLLGVLLVAAPAYDVHDDVTALSWHLSTTLAENAAFFLLAGGLVLAGGWLVRSDWETDAVAKVARRTVAGSAAAAVLVGWAIAVQRWAMHGLKPYVIALDGVLVATVIAFGVGVYSARVDRRERELRQQRTLTDYLERLDRYATELEAAETRAAAVGVVLDCVEDVLDPAGARVVLGDERTGRGDVDGVPSATADVGDRGQIAVYGTADAPHERQVLDRLAAHLDRTCDRLDRERALREERETLAFVNRTVRHDLLNDINLVRSRVRLVEDDAGSADDHLDTVADRVEEMASFVETMRAYVRALVGGDHELEAVSLEPALAGAVETARDHDPDAEVTLAGVPDVAVRADDLLDSVFENLLENAVEHNDADDPRVRVTAERRGGRVAVTVADNGPGIPDGLQESVFERGERGERSDGTGFGLHLVADAVAAYGGDVTVTDSDLGGAAFVVDLPVAGDGGRDDVPEEPGSPERSDGRSVDAMTQNL